MESIVESKNSTKVILNKLNQPTTTPATDTLFESLVDEKSTEKLNRELGFKINTLRKMRRAEDKGKISSNIQEDFTNQINKLEKEIKLIKIQHNTTKKKLIYWEHKQDVNNELNMKFTEEEQQRIDELSKTYREFPETCKKLEEQLKLTRGTNLQNLQKKKISNLDKEIKDLLIRGADIPGAIKSYKEQWNKSILKHPTHQEKLKKDYDDFMDIAFRYADRDMPKYNRTTSPKIPKNEEVQEVHVTKKSSRANPKFNFVAVANLTGSTDQNKDTDKCIVC